MRENHRGRNLLQAGKQYRHQRMAFGVYNSEFRIINKSSNVLSFSQASEKLILLINKDGQGAVGMDGGYG